MNSCISAFHTHHSTGVYELLWALNSFECCFNKYQSRRTTSEDCSDTSPSTDEEIAASPTTSTDKNVECLSWGKTTQNNNGKWKTSEENWKFLCRAHRERFGNIFAHLIHFISFHTLHFLFINFNKSVRESERWEFRTSWRGREKSGRTWQQLDIWTCGVY